MIVMAMREQNCFYFLLLLKTKLGAQAPCIYSQTIINQERY
jgi:hypothetical protein